MTKAEKAFACFVGCAMVVFALMICVIVLRVFEVL